MGEANTYMTLRFESPEEAEKSEKEVRMVVDHLNDLYDTWQNNRWSTGTFLAAVQGRFRSVLTTMGLFSKVEKDPGNGLAFGISMPGKGHTDFERVGETITWGGMTSHHVDWDYNVRAFEAVLAKRAKITWHAHDLCCDE